MVSFNLQSRAICKVGTCAQRDNREYRQRVSSTNGRMKAELAPRAPIRINYPCAQADVFPLAASAATAACERATWVATSDAARRVAAVGEPSVGSGLYGMRHPME